MDVSTKHDLTDDGFPTDPTDSAERSLSFSRLPTVLLTFAANRRTRASACNFQNRFGIGSMDWRMLVMLTQEPGSTVNHLGRAIGIDKSAVGRSPRRLEAKGLAAPALVDGHIDWVCDTPTPRFTLEAQLAAGMAMQWEFNLYRVSPR